MSNYNFRNITISGLPGAGSTTLLSHLKEALGPEGWQGYSGGEFMRQYAAEKGLFDSSKKHHHSAEDYEDDFDRKIDYGVREKLRTEQNWIIESWLSGFLAQGVPGVLKVLVICSETSIRIDRIVNRDDLTVQDALKHVEDRYHKNLTKWQRMYSQEWREWVVKPQTVSAVEPIDFWRPELYDVVIDTYSVNQQQAADEVLNALKEKPPQPASS